MSKRRLTSRETIRSYLLLMPALVFMAVVIIYPMVSDVILSLQRYRGGERVFVGFANYEYLLLRDRAMKHAIVNNALLLISIPILLGLSLFLAAVLFRRFPGWKLYQTALFLPYLLPIVAMSSVFRFMLRQNGAINTILRGVGLDFFAQDWLGDPHFALVAVGFVMVWRNLGYGVMLFLARMSSMDEDTLDAAKVDGASWLQSLIWIVIPQMRNLILFYVTFQVIVCFAWAFTYVFVLTRGGPGFSTMVLDLLIYDFTTVKRLPEIGSALAVLLLLLVGVFIYTQLVMQRRSRTYE